MKRLVCWLAALIATSFCFETRAQDERPEWTLEVKPSEKVGFESPAFFPKEYGWLLTFRLTTTSRMAIKPVGYIRFEGLNAEEEVVWTHSKLVRRVDMDAAYKGGLDLFVRVLLKDVPESVTVVTMRFDDELGGAEASEDGE